MRLRRSELQKVWGGVFDQSTIMTLYQLLKRGVITQLERVVKRGKESLVIAGTGRDGRVAIKIYAVAAANFRRMMPYLLGDPRFARIKRDRRSIVYAWCRKEFSNLQTAAAAGVACPRPLAALNNVLVMSFIGAELPAKRLCDTVVDKPRKVFERIIRNVKLLYRAGLVHADLSEYNVLLLDSKPYLIDFSQSTVLAHPNAAHWLRRDIRNICRYFSKLGIRAPEQETYMKITES